MDVDQPISSLKKTLSRTGKHRLQAIICDKVNITPSYKLINFSDVPVSTMTIIANTNININVDNFYNFIPVTDYYIVKKKRGRKRKAQPDDPNKHVPPGAIITLKKRGQIRGVELKNKKFASKTFFRHSVAVVMILSRDKMLNAKISQNGTMHFTGCRSVKHAIEFVKHIYSLMIEAEKWTGLEIFNYRTHDDDLITENNAIRRKLYDNKENDLTCIFRAAMVNVDCSLGYKLRRECLYKFINLNTEFISIFEPPLRPSVNIKIRMEDRFDENLTRIKLSACGDYIEDLVTFEEFYTSLTPKQQKDLYKKEKYHTFMCFASGSIIMSSGGKEMANIFYRLVKLLIDNREILEDKQSDDVLIDSSWIEEEINDEIE